MRKIQLLHITLLLLAIVLAGIVFTQKSENSLISDFVFQMPGNTIETRWYTSENKEAEKGAGGQANYGRKGSPNVYIPGGNTVVLADIEGSGTIRRIWFVLDKNSIKALRGFRIQMFWDGEEKPAVDAPLGDFFCQSHGIMSAFENIYFSSPEARSFNCFIPMPFKKGAKIQLINESDEPNFLFYEINTTQGDKHDDDILYFHTSWRRENPTTMRRDFTILPEIKGKGRFLGCHLGVIQNPATNHIWWGEGEYKVYLDGDTSYPTLCGTGTEDLVGSGYGQGKYDHLYQGNHYLSEEGAIEGIKPGGVVVFADRQGYYRFHVPDPLYFYHDIHIDIQVMGGSTYDTFIQAMDKDPNLKLMKTGEPGHYWTREELEKLDPKIGSTVERVDDHFATAYWYMNSPTNSLPQLAPYEKRVEGLEKEIIITSEK